MLVIWVGPVQSQKALKQKLGRRETRDSKYENPVPSSEMRAPHARLRTEEKPLGAKRGTRWRAQNLNEFGSRFFPRTSRKDTAQLTP